MQGDNNEYTTQPIYTRPSLDTFPPLKNPWKTIPGRVLSFKRTNASKDGLIKIRWVVYSLLFPCIFSLSLKIDNALFARMLRYQLGSRLELIYCSLFGIELFRVKTVKV